MGGVRRGRAALRLSELNEARRLCGILGGGMAGVVCDDGRPHQQVVVDVGAHRSSMPSCG